MWSNQGDLIEAELPRTRVLMRDSAGAYQLAVRFLDNSDLRRPRTMYRAKRKSGISKEAVTNSRQPLGRSAFERPAERHTVTRFGGRGSHHLETAELSAPRARAGAR